MLAMKSFGFLFSSAIVFSDFKGNMYENKQYRNSMKKVKIGNHLNIHS